MKKFILSVLLLELVSLNPLQVIAKPIILADLSPKNQTNSLPFLVSSQKHQPIPNIKGIGYDQARKMLIKAGWKPRLTTWKPRPDLYGNEEVFLKKGYLEMISCSGTGIASCSFLFTDSYGNYLKVVTQGQYSPDEGASVPVTKWYLSREIPSAPY